MNFACVANGMDPAYFLTQLRLGSNMRNTGYSEYGLLSCVGFRVQRMRALVISIGTSFTPVTVTPPSRVSETSKSSAWTSSEMLYNKTIHSHTGNPSRRTRPLTVQPFWMAEVRR